MTTPLEEILMRGKVDQSMQQAYAQRYPFISKAVSTPQGLMSIVDAVHKRESGNSPGTPANLFEADIAQKALRDIYGINAYHPQGFLKWSEEQGKWVDPRLGSFGDNEKPPAGSFFDAPDP